MPTRVLHLLPTLAGDDATRRVAMLCESLPADQFEQHVAALRWEGRLAERLQQTAASLHGLDRRFRRDPFVAVALRRLVGTLRPDVVHAWGADAAAFAACCDCRVVRTLGDDPALAGWLANRSTTFTPPVGWTHFPDAQQPATEALPPEIPVGARLIGVAAPLVPASGLKDLVWAIDLIRVVAPDVWLVIIGDGPQWASLKEFSRLACEQNRTVLLGDRADLSALLPHFDLWWQSGQPAEPPLALLEAMRAGLPVVADRCEGAAAAIKDRAPGYLITPGDRAERAKATLEMLEDESRRHVMSEVARLRELGRISPDAVLEACAAAYGRKA